MNYINGRQESSYGAVNDFGKPWRYEEGDLTVTRTSVWSPPGCHPVGCGLKLYVDKEGTLVKVEGDENQPITGGRLCVRCITLRDYVYNPSRILHPMKRDPKHRGKADKWEQISWDEAFEIMVTEVNKVKEKYGPESIVLFTGTGREGGTMKPLGAAVFGTPNYTYTQSGYACYAPRLAGTSYVMGAPYPEIDYAAAFKDRFDSESYALSECIVLWGKDPLPSNGDGLFGHALIDMMKRGTRLITVDPRTTWLSTKADYALKLRPGTDTALAMALLHVIISEELYDRDFIEYWTYGFEELKERVATMPPEKAAEICGLAVEDIYGAARMYANATPAGIAWGLAIDQNPNGSQLGHCILDLMAVTGNIDVPGGQIIGGASSGQQETGFGWAAMPPETAAKMIGLKEFPAYCNAILDAHADMVLDALETEQPYPLRFGYFSGNNLIAATCAAQPKRWHDAIIKSLDYCAALECFMTPSTQACCDLVLPLAATPEREGTVSNHYGATPTYMGITNKAIDYGEGMSDTEFCYELGKRLRPDIWTKYEDVYGYINALRFGGKKTFDEARQEVNIQRECEYRKFETGECRQDGKLGFNTPTGRFEFYSTLFESFGDDPLPYYEEPPYSPLRTPELLDEYPFVLTTGARVYAFFHSENRQIPFCRELNPDPLVEINPNTAKKLGIADGQWVRVYNQFGACKMKAKLTIAVNEKTIMAQHGWWFPEESGDKSNPEGVYSVWRSNINELVPHFHVGKMGWGAPFKCLLCNIEPLNENYDTNMDLIWEKFGKLVR